MHYIEELKQYHPGNEQEAADKETILAYIETFPDTILTRENRFAHMTGSSMIFNRERDKVSTVPGPGPAGMRTARRICYLSPERKRKKKRELRR